MSLKTLEINNFETLLKKEIGNSQYHYQIPSVKASFPCTRLLAPILLKKDKQFIAKYVSPFSRLFIVCQMREGDLESFFPHENQLNLPFCQTEENCDLLK